LAAVDFIEESFRNAITPPAVRRVTALGLFMVLGSCAPGEAKDGLSPSEPEAAVVKVTPVKSSILVGELVLIRASAVTANGNPDF
jgi:hypothetical protein